MFNKTLIIVATFLITASSVSEAGESQGAKLILDVDKCVSMALEGNSSLAKATQQENFARHMRRQAIGLAFPDFDLKASYTHFGEVITSKIFDQELQFTPDDQYEAKLSVSQWIYSGSVGAGLRGAEHMITGAKAARRATKNQVIADTRSSVYRAIFAKEAIRAHEESVAQLDASLKDSKKRESVGLNTNYDTMRFELRKASAEAGLLEAKNQNTIAKLALLDKLGLEPETDIEVEGELQYIPVDIALDEVIAKAKENRGELTATTEEKLVREEWVNQAKSESMPTLKAFGAYNWLKSEGGVSAQEEWVNDWNAGLRFEMSLFDGGEKTSVVKQKIVERNIAEIVENETSRRIVIEARQAYDQLKHANELVKSQQKNIEFAKETYRIASKRYELGMLTQLEFLDTQLTLTNATINHRRSLYLYMEAKEKLNQAMGMVMEK